ncbi:Qat anti-phage system associated protein QatB [Olivibacter jilunii]|uniref:Qat anti-phage system associated protein QatB n=1 Tax=Olivibacter jilunii TaxID=985016 RepID=UPI00103246F3|nr:Qat anti-phage system associated protein QatB [Olivibacter jilunii]
MPPWYNDSDSPAPGPNPDAPAPEGPPSGPPDDVSLQPSRDQNQVINNNATPLAAPEVPVVDGSSKNWGGAKGAMTRVSNNTTGASFGKAGKKYVSSLGGSKSATRAASQGIRVGSRYASFLGSLSSLGFAETLHSFGLSDFIGKSIEETCLAIANVLAPVGSTNDEAIAREAMISTLDTLYTKMEDNNINALENMTSELVKETLIEYVSNYVFSKWMYELGSTIEKGNVSEQAAVELEGAVKDLIYAETTEQYRTVTIETNTLQDVSTSRIIENIFLTAYSLLEI